MSNFFGINENNKPSSKVLRPPGGGSSDIFGTDMPQTPRAVKNHMQSNIFSSEKSAAMKNNDPDPACPVTPPESSSEPEPPQPLNIDLPCTEDNQESSEKSKDEIGDGGNVSTRSKRSEKEINYDVSASGGGDVGTQTSQNTGCNTDNPNSLTKMAPPKTIQEPLKNCVDNYRHDSRNPITGIGLGGDGVGGLKQITPKCRRDGNPVTGEGYNKPSNDGTPSLNGAREVINKNRVPPGGYSSGLW